MVQTRGESTMCILSFLLVFQLICSGGSDLSDVISTNTLSSRLTLTIHSHPHRPAVKLFSLAVPFPLEAAMLFQFTTSRPAVVLGFTWRVFNCVAMNTMHDDIYVLIVE